MTDPTRWLDDDADALARERALLSSGRSMDPPLGAQEKVWAALQIHLGPGVGSGGGSSGNAAANGSSGAGASGAGSSGASISGAIGGAKAVIAGVASVASIAGVAAALVMASPTAPPKMDIPKPQMVEELRSPNADPPEQIPSPPNDSMLDTVIPSPSSAPIPPDVQPGPMPPQRVSDAKPSVVDPAPVEEAVRARQERASRLREESRSLGDARAALRRGDAASALEKLDALGGQFPEGVLAQEREVLAIEALARAGQRAAASERAMAFLQAHPTSPHATKVRGFLQ